MKRLAILVLLLLLVVVSYSDIVVLEKFNKGLIINLRKPMFCSMVIDSGATVVNVSFLMTNNYTIEPLYGRVVVRLNCRNMNGKIDYHFNRVYLFRYKNKISKNYKFYKEMGKAFQIYYKTKNYKIYQEIIKSYILFLEHKNWESLLNNIIRRENLSEYGRYYNLSEILDKILSMHNKIRLIYQISGVINKLKICIENETHGYSTNCSNVYLLVRNELVSLVQSFVNSEPKYIKYTNKFNETKQNISKLIANINESLTSNQDLVKNAKKLEKLLDKILEKENEFKNSLIKKKVVVLDYKNRKIPFAIVTVNNFFANLTNFNGSITLYLASENQSINATAPGYKFLEIKKDKDSVVIILKPKLNLSPIVYHYLIVNYTYGAICSTRNQPHCISSYNGTVYLHPNSIIIRKLVSVIPKNYITLCKSGVNCTKLLWNISALIHGVVKYNKYCLTKNLTEFKKYCMAWWDTDLDIVKYHSGVCSDYARLALSILRSLGIPARYVVIHGWAFGFGYFDHVFTQVYTNGHWIFYDPLWNYTVVPQYPLLCVDSIYTPYAVTYGNITIVRNISLIKDLLKYYNISTNCSKAL